MASRAIATFFCVGDQCCIVECAAGELLTDHAVRHGRAALHVTYVFS